MPLHEFLDGAGEPQVITYEVENFRLEAGPLVPKIRLGLCVYGTGNKPIIVVHPAVSGSPKIAASDPKHYGEGWWTKNLGPGRLLDTEKYRIVGVGHVGGIGPSSTANELREYHRFLSANDTSRLTAKVLRQLGEGSIHAAIGASLGVNMVRHWAFQEDVHVRYLVEIFGNFGNNYEGSVANEVHRLHYDILTFEGGNTDRLVDRYRRLFLGLSTEAHGFAIAYEYVLQQIPSLYVPRPKRRLQVARMIAYFRFVTPFYFQEKWDKSFAEGGEDFANNRMGSLLEHVATAFSETFDEFTVATLRALDAKPSAIAPDVMADALRKKSATLIGLIVRGDRIYNSDLQFVDYRKIQVLLADDDNAAVEILICQNQVRGHDHFLDPAFAADAKAITSLWDA